MRTVHTTESSVILKGATRSNPNSISGAIAGPLEAQGVVEKEGTPSIKVIPCFMELEIDSDRRTGIRFIVER